MIYGSYGFLSQIPKQFLSTWWDNFHTPALTLFTMYYYILNLDHHGGHQGICNRFDTLEEAKHFLDTLPDTNPGSRYIRAGRIAYKIIDGSTSYAFAIVEIDMKVVKDKKTKDYDVPEPSDGEKNMEAKWKRHDKFVAPINKMLDFLELNIELLTDRVD